MKRRDFLHLANTAVLSTALNGLPIRTLGQNPLLQLLARQTAENGKVMVFIQLIGGNDGLNTIIPIDQYSALANARPNLVIAKNKLLPLNGTDTTGLHPALGGLRNMYNDGLMNVVQSVSYPDQSFSHFRATDIWLTGSDSLQYLNTGWLGRYLSEEHPGYPNGYPNSNFPHPLAIEIGNETSIALMGTDVCMGMAISTIDSFYNIINNEVASAPNSKAGHELTFLRYVAQQSHEYTSALQNAAAKAKNKAAYPDSDALAEQLKIVARLIAGGLNTPVYIVSLGGFDTHASQVDSADTSAGKHSKLLGKLSAAVAAFFDDCRQLNIDDRVAAMTISEFGRRIKSNASVGTDHGTAGPVMVFGSGVNPGFIGSNPVIPEHATVYDNLEMQHDFRSVYASVLSDWFEVERAILDKVLPGNFEVLPIFRKNKQSAASTEMLSQNFPNPFTNNTTVPFVSQGGLVSIELYHSDGRMVRTITKQAYPAGPHTITISRDGLQSGIYFMHMANLGARAVKKVIITD